MDSPITRKEFYKRLALSSLVAAVYTTLDSPHQLTPAER